MNNLWRSSRVGESSHGEVEEDGESYPRGKYEMQDCGRGGVGATPIENGSGKMVVDDEGDEYVN